MKLYLIEPTCALAQAFRLGFDVPILGIQAFRPLRTKQGLKAWANEQILHPCEIITADLVAG